MGDILRLDLIPKHYWPPRARWRWFLCFYLLLILLLTASCGFFLLRELEEGYSLFNVTQMGIAFWLLAAFALTAIPCALWQFRAHANLRDQGVNGLKYPPASALGSYFIPFVNLIVPPRAMRELWNRSHGEEAHFAQISVGDVTNWWMCFVIGCAIQLGLTFVALVNVLTNIKIVTPPGANLIMELFSLLLLGGAAILLFRIISAVTRAQQVVTHVGDTFA